jgi:hypothetical protein
MSIINRNSIGGDSIRTQVTRTLAASVVVFGLTSGALWAQRLSGTGVDLRTPSVRTWGDMNFDCQGAGYDDCYKDHWRITSLNGSMTFRFQRGGSFVFHGLGSTSEGRSYCYVNVYVNGQLERERMFIEKEWQDYVVPVRAGGSGEIAVRIELVGQTHLWLDRAMVRHESGGEPEQGRHEEIRTDSHLRQVKLRTAGVRTIGDIGFDYQGAGYDDCYKDHWRITSLHGSMTFRFQGGRALVFHGLGSTSQGQSHCYVNIYVNGQLERERLFIEKQWQDYVVPVRGFGSGENSVRIELVGQTHLWIDRAVVR